MTVSLYGLIGHAGKLELPIDQLDVEELEPGREFEFEGNLYEIRSVHEGDREIRINVVLSMILSHS